ncbi:MAG TPA: mechanosensitive ion channel domain-containing protein [Gaiellaceae bacterium]|nr:mechanosensitive ion channel domain-containing protein [Gaiellaceae bacterium]
MGFRVAVANPIDELDRHTGLGRPLSTVLVIVALFLLAWVVSKIATRIAAAFVDRSERRRSAEAKADSSVISSLRQRETAISLIETTIRSVAYLLAFVLSLAALAGGTHRLETVLGASFIAIIIAFAAQRFLMDVIAGLLMFFEGWFRIGDTVAIDALQVKGVVEAVSLRSLTIRAITGEIQRVPNSQVIALRVTPRGYHELEVEFFTSALEPGRELVEQVARIVPVGPTRFVSRPELVDTEELDADLYRITAHCAVAVGREWLAEDLLPALIKERATKGLLIHGPIVTYIDEQAAQSFQRALMPGPEKTPVADGSKA